MQCILATGGNAIVTTGAHPENLGMVDPACRQWRPWYWSRQVTGFANSTGIDMKRALARGDDTVMAAKTGAIHLGVIHGSRRYRHPRRGSGLVATAAQSAAINVGSTTTTGANTIVATETDTCHLAVIHCSLDHWRPGHRTRSVAGITLVSTGNMGGRFALCSNSIVTTATSTYGLTMVYRCRQ